MRCDTLQGRKNTLREIHQKRETHEAPPPYHRPCTRTIPPADRKMAFGLDPDASAPGGLLRSSQTPPARPPRLACPHVRSADLSVVVLETSASVLGRLLSSSAPPESRRSPGALRRLGWLALPETAALCSRDLSGENCQEFSREPAPDLPGENSWDKSQENCRESVPAGCRPCHLQHERSCTMTLLALTDCCRLLAIDG